MPALRVQIPQVLNPLKESAEKGEKNYVALSAEMRGVSKNRKAWLEKVEGAVGGTLRRI